jgi:hypothetical protein
VFELAIAATDYFALRALLGEPAARVAASTWVRAMALAYGLGVLLPAGRAGGEVARAAVLARDLDIATAARAGARLQCSSLYANAIASIVLCALVWSTPLGWALLANALLCGGFAATLDLAVRSGRFARLVQAILRRYAPSRLTNAASAPPTPLARPVLLSTLGRAVQTLQYGIVVFAVGATASFRNAVAAEGIHLVGATAGDAIPNQLGVTEGAYRLFASSLDLGAAPEKALSIALVIRCAQIALAFAMLVIAAAAGRKTA